MLPNTWRKRRIARSVHEHRSLDGAAPWRKQVVVWSLFCAHAEGTSQSTQTTNPRSLVRIPKTVDSESFLEVTLKELMRKSSARYSLWSNVPFVGSVFSR